MSDIVDIREAARALNTAIREFKKSPNFEKIEKELEKIDKEYSELDAKFNKQIDYVTTKMLELSDRIGSLEEALNLDAAVIVKNCGE